MSLSDLSCEMKENQCKSSKISLETSYDTNERTLGQKNQKISFSLKIRRQRTLFYSSSFTFVDKKAK